MKTITIKVNDPKNNEVSERTIPVKRIIGRFAVHRPFTYQYGASDQKWTVTHIRSGLSVCSYVEYLDSAVSAAEFSNRLWDLRGLPDQESYSQDFMEGHSINTRELMQVMREFRSGYRRKLCSIQIELLIVQCYSPKAIAT